MKRGNARQWQWEMDRVLRWLVLAVLMAAIWLTATGCADNGPVKKQIEKDLLGTTLQLEGISYRIADTKEIKKLKVLETRENAMGVDCVVGIKLENEDLEAELEAEMTYLRVLDAWVPMGTTVLASVAEARKDPGSEAVIGYIKDADGAERLGWQLEETDHVEVEIESVRPSGEPLAVDLTARVRFENAYSSMTSDVAIGMALRQEHGRLAWQVQDMTVIETGTAVLAPLADKAMEESLVHLGLRREGSEFWRIDSTDEMHALTVAERLTDLEAGTDQVEARVVLQKENARCEGTLDLLYRFDAPEGGAGRWQLETTAVREDFVVEPLVKMALDEGRILEDLYRSGLEFDVDGSNKEVPIGEAALTHFSIGEMAYSSDGRTALIGFDMIAPHNTWNTTHVAHFDAVATDGDDGKAAKITYVLDEAGWTFQPKSVYAVKLRPITADTAAAYVDSKENYFNR